MKLKLDDYRHWKKNIVECYRDDGMDKVTFFCVFCNVPIAAAISYIKEEYPKHSKDLDKHLDEVIKFYGYQEIK